MNAAKKPSVPNVRAAHATNLGGRPLDGVVRALFETTWGSARGWIESGKVALDGEVVNDTLRRVREGAEVTLTMTARRSPRRGELGDERIVHCDPHLIVVDKPSGVSTVPYEEGEEGTLEELVRKYLHRIAGRERDGGRPALGVVHRIDKETSGLVVFTRTWLAKQSLSSQFRAHTVHRRYLALANGIVTSQTFRTHLIENRGDGLRGSLEAKTRRGVPISAGQLAVTHVEALEVLANGRATLIACRLETGRTHQIRIHLSEAGHPLAGERVYSRGHDPAKLVPAPRLMLHAAELGFVHPATEREVKWTSEPPGDFASVLARLK